jgi:hypothetical protein
LRICKYFFLIWIRPDADLETNKTCFWVIKNML